MLDGRFEGARFLGAARIWCASEQLRTEIGSLPPFSSLQAPSARVHAKFSQP